MLNATIYLQRVLLSCVQGIQKGVFTCSRPICKKQLRKKITNKQETMLPKGNHLSAIELASVLAEATAFLMANGTDTDKQIGGSLIAAIIKRVYKIKKL